MTTSDHQFFNQSVGWGMIIGVGASFMVLMIGTTYLLKVYRGETQTSEMLMTANHSLKRGLTAAAVVSSWTIGSTLLLSTTSAYNLGVSGPFWYGAGACVQIIMFCVLALEIKRKAPNAHTYQEIVKLRYGSGTHILSCCYSIFQQVSLSTNLLVNGSSVFSNLTGINRDACIVLLPLFVTIYTLIGGIKATFISDYTHSAIIYIIMLIFLFVTFTTSDKIGSPGELYRLLVEAGERYPVEGNKDGSLLTMNSVNGGLFGLVLFGAGWASAIDSQLMQKALAANQDVVLSSYVIGGIAWFTLPFVLASTLGLACRGLEVTEYFPNFPERLTAQEINDGLVMPISGYILLGKGGAGAVLTMIFMACTAAFSSEAIACSSLISYDIYKAYINPKATGRQLVFVSHSGVILFFVVCIALAIGFSHANFDVAFITTVSGIVVDVCVVPMYCTLFWNKMSSHAYIYSTLASTMISIGIWIGYAASESNGVINLTTLSTYRALAAGNTSSVSIPLLLVPLIVWFKPADFDWKTWKTIKRSDDAHTVLTIDYNEKVAEATIEQEPVVDERILLRRRKFGVILIVIFSLFFLVLFPLPLYGTRYVFSSRFFTGWVVVMFIWAFYAAIVIVLMPIWDGRHAVYSIVLQLFGKKVIIEAESFSAEGDQVSVSASDQKKPTPSIVKMIP